MAHLISVFEAFPPLLPMFLLGSIAFQPSVYRSTFRFLIATLSIYSVLSSSDGDPLYNQSLTYLFNASDYILLTDAQRELRLVDQGDLASDLPFKSRLVWALKLFLTPRGIGWAHEPTSVIRPPPPATSRFEFSRHCILWAVIYYLILDAATVYCGGNPAFAAGGSLAADGWLWRYVNVAAIGSALVALISILYCIVAAISVVLNLSDARLWPHFFGFWTDAYTIRRFWGRTWHQGLRRPLSAHGKYMAHEIFGFPPGSCQSSYIQLYTAFLISGLIHYVSLRHWGTGPVWFFLLQAVAISFEDGVIALARELGFDGKPRLWTKIVGYIWVSIWFTWSVPMWVDVQIASGFPIRRLDISVIGLLQRVFA